VGTRLVTESKRCPVSRWTARLLGVGLLAGATGNSVADDLVAVSAGSLDRYWVAVEPTLRHLELGSQRKVGYGCAVLPVIINREGRVEVVGTLLMWSASPLARRSLQPDEITSMAARTLPTYQPAGDRRPDADIYTALSIPFVDGRLQDDLGVEDFHRLVNKLISTCDVEDPAGLRAQADGKTIHHSLPASPTEFLAD
jgi:hypothetical protein